MTGRRDRKGFSAECSRDSKTALRNSATATMSCWKQRCSTVPCSPRVFVFCVLSLGWYFFLGEDFFPSVDAGQMRLHVRARAGLRVEETARLCDEIEAYLKNKSRKTKS